MSTDDSPSQRLQRRLDELDQKISELQAIARQQTEQAKRQAEQVEALSKIVYRELGKLEEQD